MRVFYYLSGTYPAIPIPLLIDEPFDKHRYFYINIGIKAGLVSGKFCASVHHITIKLNGFDSVGTVELVPKKPYTILVMRGIPLAKTRHPSDWTVEILPRGTFI